MTESNLEASPAATAPYRRWLSSIYRARRWIVATDVLAGSLAIADAIEAIGSAPPLCVAAAPGTVASTTSPRSPEPIVLDVRAADMLAAVWASLDALADLPAWAIERVDAFDPEHRARVLGAMFDDGRPLAGRDKYGSRPDAWRALEDKTTIDALWDAAGVSRAPSAIVSADLASLRAASASLDRGAGCVWVGDNRGGFHGGAVCVRWVRTEADAREAADFFAARCDRARVMPFLDGIPCSIHALVLPDRTLAFRPCEMIVLRRPGEGRLQYAQAATSGILPPPIAKRCARSRSASEITCARRSSIAASSPSMA